MEALLVVTVLVSVQNVVDHVCGLALALVPAPVVVPPIGSADSTLLTTSVLVDPAEGEDALRDEAG